MSDSCDSGGDDGNANVMLSITGTRGLPPGGTVKDIFYLEESFLFLDNSQKKININKNN